MAERFGATRFIKLSHKVEECVWDDGDKKWSVGLLAVFREYKQREKRE